jgi:hypothetical protein
VTLGEEGLLGQEGLERGDLAREGVRGRRRGMEE